jgi:predicted enzyme related to lactoylglutathione lyase
MERVGRWAVVADPQGGVFAPFEAAPGRDEAAPSAAMEPVGNFCWDELLAVDPAASERFYTSLFSWTTQHMDMGEAGPYTLLSAGETQVGGLMKTQGPPVTCWLSYVHVADVDASAKKAAELGGTVLAGPFDIAGVGRSAVVSDPVGATIALYKRTRA